MKTLKDYARFLKDEYLLVLTKENLKASKAAKIPILKYFKHLSEEKLLQMGLEGQGKLLDSFIAGTAVEETKSDFEKLEKDELPGLSKDQILPVDLVQIYGIQRRTLIKFIPIFTTDIN